MKNCFIIRVGRLHHCRTIAMFHVKHSFSFSKIRDCVINFYSRWGKVRRGGRAGCGIEFILNGGRRESPSFCGAKRSETIEYFYGTNYFNLQPERRRG